MGTQIIEGVYGINLSKRLQGPKTSDLALLTEIEHVFEELDADHGGEPDGVGLEVYELFAPRLAEVFRLRGIVLPPIVPYVSEPLFRIFRVSSDAEINPLEEFEIGDLILGVFVTSFPNKISFPPSFDAAAQWHLWSVPS